ncbi:MAG: hypothetical protein ACOH5I_19860 [Oligoflexus sp.]
MKILPLSLSVLLILSLCELMAEAFQFPQISAISDAHAYGARRTVVAASGPRGGTVVAARRTVVGGGYRPYSMSLDGIFKDCNDSSSSDLSFADNCRLSQDHFKNDEVGIYHSLNQR